MSDRPAIIEVQQQQPFPLITRAMPNLASRSADPTTVRPKEKRVRPVRPVGLRTVLAIAAMAVFAGCMGISPQAEMDAAESLLSLNDALLSIREEQAYLQDEIDELRQTIARQDSLIRRVADFTGAPIPR